MAEGGGPVGIECGFCFVKNNDIQDPRVLPCSHIFCTGCLVGQLEHLKVIRCPACSNTYDVVVDNLPRYKPDGPKHKCDVCTKKGKGDQPAVMYCNSCTKKYCETHQESHDDVLVDHVTMSIAEYVSQADRLETRHCTEHKEQPYSLGCGACLTVFCASCISPLNICTNGKDHKLVNLGDLVTRVTSDINKLREAMICKEEKLSALFKKASKNISEYEQETKEMIEKLHETRDKQIDVIQTKYRKLEEELIKTRKMTRAEMLLFMEEEVGNNLTSLSNHRMRIEARVRNNHQVDIVNTYRDMQTEIVKLTDGQFPVLSLDNVKASSVTDEKRDIEAEIVPAGRIYISCEPELAVLPPPKSFSDTKFPLCSWNSVKPTPKSGSAVFRFCYDSNSVLPPPKPLSDMRPPPFSWSAVFPPQSLTLLKSVKTDSFCHSLCHYKGDTYLGMQNCTIDVIDRDFDTKTFASLGWGHWPYGVTVHQDNIYSLVTGSSSTINVYDLNSKLIKTWNRSDTSHFTRLAIVSNKVVVPDGKGKRLTVYSLTGDIIKHIPCPMLKDGGSAACAVDESSVIVTSYYSSVVFRVDINSEQTLWKCGSIACPQAAAMYERKLVCIASERKLSFLKVNTGQLMSEMKVSGIHRTVGWMIDIDIHDTTLIASTCVDEINKVLFYKVTKLISPSFRANIPCDFYQH